MSLIRQCLHRSCAGSLRPTVSVACSVKEGRRTYASSSSIARASVESASPSSSNVFEPLQYGDADIYSGQNSAALTSLASPSTIVLEGDRLPHLKSMLEMALVLKDSNHLQNDAKRIEELEALIQVQGPLATEGAWPLWVEQEYHAFRLERKKSETSADRAYRRARSMLWTPESLDRESLNQMIERHEQTLDGLKQSIWCKSDREEQLDTVLRSIWDDMTAAERAQANLRAKYECVRKLGWRRGYTSGYPTADENVREERLSTLAKIKTGSNAEAKEKMEEWSVREEEEAWLAWQSLDSVQRQEEESLAWQLRDRSLIFIDDTSGVHVADSPFPRWYPTPQRAGQMVFLPNDTVRLVRNTTRTGEEYDHFKATFRVPLHMHKHGLRSYLLAIYGLRTTWIRSMIYRAPIVRNRLRQKEYGSTTRTFKKIEVGLLEPFVFPELSESFVREHLLSEEMKAANTSIFYKMTGRRRWRTYRLPDPVPFDPHAGAIEETTMTTKLQANQEASHTQKKDGAQKKKSDESNRLSNLAGGVPTKRHSRILQMLNDQRAVREARIAVEAQRLRKQHEQSQEQ
ncbi:uncharacterized protein FA14DRAFT_159779 [Meira miltonrushii]|uniref:Large ribosomal subunit protein uL23m n=1 Tax=Meira miltonrushii TaxID=1280837 RepID=A0A316VKE7_9BASI|nr:uncharacterized protein FA14DRAFT_159779 [Meira miltonrushii]PWN38000.1 hypothetical protein FA14DRAFT_159779 [Meira miltonrushii]